MKPQKLLSIALYPDELPKGSFIRMSYTQLLLHVQETNGQIKPSACTCAALADTCEDEISDEPSLLPNFAQTDPDADSVILYFMCRSRKEYLELLRNDLMNYYSYSEFMINKLMDMFPLSEVSVFIPNSAIFFLWTSCIRAFPYWFSITTGRH